MSDLFDTALFFFCYAMTDTKRFHNIHNTIFLTVFQPASNFFLSFNLFAIFVLLIKRKKKVVQENVLKMHFDEPKIKMKGAQTDNFGNLE